jgi:hypothetical protein
MDKLLDGRFVDGIRTGGEAKWLKRNGSFAR